MGILLLVGGGHLGLYLPKDTTDLFGQAFRGLAPFGFRGAARFRRRGAVRIRCRPVAVRSTQQKCPATEHNDGEQSRYHRESTLSRFQPFAHNEADPSATRLRL